MTAHSNTRISCLAPTLGALALVAAGVLGCIAPPYYSGGRAPSIREVMRDEPPIPNILVDQTGYLPGLPKLATLKVGSPASVPTHWDLVDAKGAVVASGTTSPFGHDEASGDDVQLIDFSAFSTPGSGYRLRVNGETSHPFDVGADVYHRLKYDALAFFTLNRSGIDIVMPWAGDAKWTHPAGHLGDRHVPCLPAKPCPYALDVSGGWYDAGDHGKYVVNGGIALWTLLDLYERLAAFGRTAADFADGKMRVPEAGNGVPDLLDEARWEMEWMLKMQVPVGQPLAGMAHHKIHDRSWTTLALAPNNDPEPRYLHPPSTAATLNLAATAAQAARIWKTLDPAFAARCLTAAERAWQAAQVNPGLFAPAVPVVGGGPYDDRDVTDEAYWAAAELFITTGCAAYHAFLVQSPHFAKVPVDLGEGGRPEQASAMTWQRTGALGTLSLAIVPNTLPANELAAMRAAVVAAADAFVAAIAAEGYRTPFRASSKGYPWGSNSDVANDLLVIALAGDLTGDARYPAAVATGFGYLLGRNPLDKSYVTGYGERPLRNPHHRFWAHQYNFRFPEPPPGVLSGGPNSGLQDPTIRSLGSAMTGCRPEKCYADHIESWSTNEVAINWNAPFAWVAAYLDEQGRGPLVAPPVPAGRAPVARVARGGKRPAPPAARP